MKYERQLQAQEDDPLLLMVLTILYIGKYAQTRTRTGDIQIFSLTLSQLSYLGKSGPDAIRTHDLRHVKATS